MPAIFSKGRSVDMTWVGVDPDRTVVAKLNLPAGNWVANAAVSMSRQQPSDTTTVVQAGFMLDDQLLTGAVQSNLSTLTGDGSLHGFLVIPLVVAVTLTKPQVLQIWCTTLEPMNVWTQDIPFSAVQVDSLTIID